MTWLGRLRLRLFVTLPLVGVAIAAVTMTVNKTSKISAQRCWTCGTSLRDEPAGEQGVVCPSCGSLNQFNPRHLALGDAPEAGYDFTLDHGDEDEPENA